MNNVFLIGELVNDIEIINSNGNIFTNNFVIRNEFGDFEIISKNDLANDLYENTSKGDMVAIQGHLAKSKQDTSRIIIIANSVKEFRNEKTDARIANEYNGSSTEKNNILKNINKSTVSELLNQIGKIVDIINNTQVTENKSIEEQHKDTRDIKQNIDVSETFIDTKASNLNQNIDNNQRKDAETLV